MARATTKTASKNSQRIWILGGLLIAVTAVAYFPAWNGRPIWDDTAHITKPELRSASGLVRIWTERNKLAL